MSKILLISDIHGFYSEFQQLLSYANFNIADDYLISLGDMIDRGKHGFKVVEWFRKMNVATNGRVQSLFGNHEHLFLSYLSGHISQKDYCYTAYGGESTIKSYEGLKGYMKTHASFMATMPLTLEIDNIVLTHANINLSKPLDSQTPYDTLWDYNLDFYKKEINDDKIYIFGHTPTFYINKDMNESNNIKHYKDYYEIWRKDNKICIDCTYHKERKLSILDITNDIEYYIDFNTKELYKK